MTGVVAYHVVFGTYGFWLPNDPRGSWSDFVGSWELFRFGPATKTDTRRSIAARPHDRRARLEAKEALKYPAVVLDGHQALEVARGFGRVAARSDYLVHACSILPQHVHLVLGRHHCRVEQMAARLKAAATSRLAAAGRHSLAAYPGTDGSLPSPWARRVWKVFLNTPEEVARSVRYVEENPLRERKRPQRWSFVTAPALT
jgi:REP element-mobilizing transposase RayT